MPNEPSRSEYAPAQRRRLLRHSSGVLRRSLSWMLGAVTLVSFVAIPLVFSQDFNLWQEVPTNNPFAATLTLVPTNATPSEVTAAFFADIGRQDPTNIYGRHVCDPLVFQVDQTGLVHARLPDTNTCVSSGDLAGTAGTCCAGEQGWTSFGVTNWAATAPGNQLTEYQFAATPPYVGTVTPIDPLASLQSATYERWAMGYVATGYNTTTGMVDIYIKLDGGDWMFVGSQACDSPGVNYHWATEVDPDGDKLLLVCRNDGPVFAHQYSLGSGSLDWSVEVDDVPASTALRYQQVDLCGLVNFGDGSTGQAAAILSPSPADAEFIVFGPTGTAVTPTHFGTRTFPGSAPDRQIFVCDGSMVHYHGASPDGFGALTRTVNCGGVDGACIGRESEEDTRDVDWAGTFDDRARFVIGPTSTPAAQIQYDRLPVVEGDDSSGEGIDVVRYGVVTVPFFFDSFEGGDLRMWDSTIGVAELPDGTSDSEEPDRR